MDTSGMIYDSTTMTYTDDLGNTYTYDFGGNLVPVESGTNADPYNMDSGGYTKALETIAPGITSKIKATQQPGESWFSALTKLLPAVTMTAQQYQLMQINVKRAEQGLPPIDVAAYSGAGVNVGLSATTRQWLMYGGLAFLAVYLLKGKK